MTKQEAEAIRQKADPMDRMRKAILALGDIANHCDLDEPILRGACQEAAQVLSDGLGNHLRAIAAPMFTGELLRR